MITPAGSFVDNQRSGSGAAGVSSLNGETGAVTIVAGTNITVTPVGQNITIAASSGGGSSFGRNVIALTTYMTVASDVGKVLDVQTSSATTITLQTSPPVPAFVRSYGFNRTAGSGTTATLAGVTFTTGDLAVITIAWYNNTVGTVADAITVIDSNGNTWAKVPNTFVINPSITGGLSATGAGQQLWYSNITSGGSGITITATFPSTVQFPAIYGAEALGVSVIDQSASNQANGVPTSGNITTTAASTFVYGSVYDDGGGSSAGGTGWTFIQSGFNFYENEYRLPVATGTFAATTNQAGTVQFTAAIAAFKGVAATPFSGFIQNNGTSVVVVTPQSGLINGKASLTLEPGQGCTIGTDGTNFTAVVTAYLGADEIPYAAGSLDEEFLGTSLNLSRWTWDNQGSVVATVAKSRVSFSGNTTGQGAMIYQTAPGTPWEVTAGPFSMNMGNGGGAFGLGLRDGTGKVMLFVQYLPNVSTENLLLQRDNTLTSFNSNINGTPLAWAFLRLHYLRIADDGVNITYSASNDGIGFYQVFQESRTAWFGSGPTQVGILIGSLAGSSLTLDWFRRTV